MTRKSIFTVACILLAVIVFSTLSPIRLRPKTGFPNVERFIAFFVLGVAYALALPKHRTLVAVCLVVGATALEAAQTWAPGRDPEVGDALVKASGALIGVMIARLLDKEVERRRAGRSRIERPA